MSGFRKNQLSLVFPESWAYIDHFYLNSDEILMGDHVTMCHVFQRHHEVLLHCAYDSLVIHPNYFMLFGDLKSFFRCAALNFYI